MVTVSCNKKSIIDIEEHIAREGKREARGERRLCRNQSGPIVGDIIAKVYTNATSRGLRRR